MRPYLILLTTFALALVATACKRDGDQNGPQTGGGGAPSTSQGQATQQGGSNQRGPSSPPATPVATRSVVINGVRLDDRTVQQIEQAYRVRVVDGDYWYDPATGAWGQRGGPAAGLILAGLRIGGPLRADASGGGTGVFVNGRELHPIDVQRLQQIGQGPVPLGRYWMDASGNYGYEGGPALGNLWALASQTGAPREGILSTYDKTGVAVIGGDVLIR